MDIRIVGAPTVRDPDGLALGSRNSCLSPNELKSALSLNHSLDLAREMVNRGERGAHQIKKAVTNLINGTPHTEIDYVSLCHCTTQDELDAIETEALLALAVRIGKARLIDNMVLKI